MLVGLAAEALDVESIATGSFEELASTVGYEAEAVASPLAFIRSLLRSILDVVVEIDQLRARTKNSETWINLNMFIVYGLDTWADR